MDTVNEQATFQQDDIFHRVDFAKRAMALINSHPSEHGACVISIDAPWGMGKSTFLHMWMNELESYNQDDSEYQEPLFQRQPNMCIYYNAWEKDYHSNAFVPLLFTMCGSLLVEKEEKEEREEKKLTLLQRIVGAGAGILGYFACASTTQDQGLATMVGGLASTATESVMQMFRKEDLNTISENYLKEIKFRDGFRNAVSDLAQEAGKLFFFVDELDRCKPLFAIQTLECIKHFFNIPNVVFIFATDISQLAHSVAGVYGQGINAGGYLSKFFDYQLHLPAPNVYDLLRYSYPQISIEREYYGLLNEIIHSVGLTPREMPIIIDQVNTFWRVYQLNNQGFYPSFIVPYLILFLGLKYRSPDLYQSYFEGSLEWETRINKKAYQKAYEMLEYTFTSLQIDKTKESELNRWIQIYDTALRTREPKDSIDYNLPYLFACLSKGTVNEIRTLREVLQSAFEIATVD